MQLRFYLTIGICLILGGFLMDSGRIIDLLKHRSDHSSAQVYAEASQNVKVSGHDQITGFPRHIELPDVNISLPVQPGHYDSSTQTWTLSSTSAYFATATLPPNNVGGNTFIYGHDVPSVFKRLNDIKPGQKVIITTDNNHKFIYEFVDENDTSPNDVSLFNYKGKPVLTLQTCSGFFSQNRRMFVFSLVEVK